MGGGVLNLGPGIESLATPNPPPPHPLLWAKVLPNLAVLGEVGSEELTQVGGE